MSNIFSPQDPEHSRNYDPAANVSCRKCGSLNYPDMVAEEDGYNYSTGDMVATCTNCLAEADAPYRYIGVYTISRHQYGGPEEGGWYYDYLHHIASYYISEWRTQDEIDAAKAEWLGAWEKVRNGQHASDDYTNWYGDLVALSEYFVGQHRTRNIPKYE